MFNAGRGKGNLTRGTIDPILLWQGNAVHLMPTSWKRIKEKRKRDVLFDTLATILFVVILIIFFGALIKIT